MLNWNPILIFSSMSTQAARSRGIPPELFERHRADFPQVNDRPLGGILTAMGNRRKLSFSLVSFARTTNNDEGHDDDYNGQLIVTVSRIIAFDRHLLSVS